MELKKKNPKVRVYVLYRDIRTYGLREDLYRRARSEGVLFIRYVPEEKPQVTAAGGQVQVVFREPLLNKRVMVQADILGLAAGIVANPNGDLAKLFKVPTDSDGWFLEAHQKLRPVDFANDGVFLCGMAHYPKPIDESIAQAQAAAARAMTVLSQDRITVGGVVSRIAPERCSGCLGCIHVCPYGAITFNDVLKVAEINPALCKGCGACAAACPSEAPVLMGFNNKQIYAQIESALAA